MHQKTCLGWLINKRTEKVKSFNGTLALKNKKKLANVEKYYVFQKNIYINSTGVPQYSHPVSYIFSC